MHIIIRKHITLMPNTGGKGGGRVGGGGGGGLGGETPSFLHVFYCGQNIFLLSRPLIDGSPYKYNSE